MNLNKMIFYITIDSTGKQVFSFWFEPEDTRNLLLYYNSFLQTSTKIGVLLDKIQIQLHLENPNEDLGENETSLIIKNDMAILNATYISGIPEMVIEAKQLIVFLTSYKSWILQYETCKIPGLIPTSKLDTWSCVPNEYIKPEYWELIRQQQESKE